jgi:hypothetical protein
MEQHQEESRRDDRQGTPERPPYSPVTPVLTHLATLPGGASILPPDAETSPATVYTNPGGTSGAYHADNQQQPPVPISESGNPDVIALRSAISILQFQKQQSLKDIKTLDQMKTVAASDPEKFTQELVAGHLSTPNQENLAYVLPPGEDAGGDEADGDSPQTKENASAFPKLPQAQNVVRMPPINWAKYQVVGEPLDRMHEEQRRRPFPGEPRRDDTFQRAPEHVIAAPYRPLTDKLESPAKSQGTKKDKKPTDR